MSENGVAELESGQQKPLVDGGNGTRSAAPLENDQSAKFRFLISVVGILFLASCMYFWDVKMAQTMDVSSVQGKSGQAKKIKPPTAVTSAPIQSPLVEAPSPKEVTEPDSPSESLPTEIPVEPVKETEAPVESVKETAPPAEETEAPKDDDSKATDPPTKDSSATETTPIESDGTCDALCDKREEARISKFGGDLLNVTDVVRMATQARDATIASLREVYGTYFDAIFVDSASEGPGERYKGITETGEKSTYRLRRKLKLQVLRMMQEVRETESNVLGCDCVKRQGKAAGSPDESVESVPDFYGKYVFANGGHSQAAAHGNQYRQSYTAVLTEDLKPVWKALGIDFVGRNYAVGGISATPIVSTCSKEIFGNDVNFLVWNYGMTDKSKESIMYYLYRAAINPGRPAFLLLDSGHMDSNAVGLVTQGGLSMHTSKVDISNVPESKPDGIDIPTEEMEAIPPLLQHLKADKTVEDPYYKWSCTKAMHEAGSDCKCWDIKGQTGWHAGYRSHALQGRQISLSFITILFDALEEIIQSPKDVASLLADVEDEENAEFENFLSLPVIGTDGGKGGYTEFSAALDPTLLDTWFKGPSICRTSLLPAESRYLGLTTNTSKTGTVARYGEETYDTGILVERTEYPELSYTFPEGVEPVPGEFNVIGRVENRVSMKNEDCPEIIKPDYPDWFWGVWKDGKTSTIFPNEKEMEHYGYDADKFKGIIGLIPTMYSESYKRKTPSIDFALNRLQENVKMTVNGKPVAKYRMFAGMAIIEDENGSVQWPQNENGQYVLEFEAFGVVDGSDNNRTALEHHLRFSGFVLY